MLGAAKGFAIVKIDSGDFRHGIVAGERYR
jgi:hypothetical protein